MNLRKLTLGIIAASLLAAPTLALAQGQQVDSNARGQGFKFTPNFEGVENTSTGLIPSIVNVINALLVLAAIAAVVFMIIGGVRYISSQGDEDAVEQAKNTVIYAIIGVIVIILAAVIVNFFVLAIA